jgi:hypothetical protein
MAAPSLGPADPAPPHLALTNDVRADVSSWVQDTPACRRRSRSPRADGGRSCWKPMLLAAVRAGRNGGHVSKKFRVPCHVVNAMHGRDAARRRHHVGKQTVETVVELIDEHGWPTSSCIAARAGRRLVRFAYEIAKSEFALPAMPGA